MTSDFRLTIVAILLAACPARAFAQAEPRVPPGAVFGGGGSDGLAVGHQKLDVGAEITEAYDQDVFLQSGGAKVSLFQGSGLYTMLAPSLDYVSLGERVQIGVAAGTNARYYSDLQTLLMSSESVGAGVTVHLSPVTTLVLGQGVTHGDQFLSGLFSGVTTPTAGGIVPPDSNYALNTVSSFASTTSASLSRQITHRATIAFSSSFKYTNTDQTASYPDLRTGEGGGLFSYSMGRNVGLRLGYTFRQGQYAGSPQSTEHNLNIGIDYSRPLSRTRRTAVSFNLGPTAVTAPLLTGSADVRRQYRIIADGSLKHQFGRTWSLVGNYHRGMGYIEGFRTPVFTAAYSAATGGYLNRRADVSLSAAYSTGESALTGNPNQFTTYTGDARLRIAVNRTVATYVEYLFYYYEFTQQLALPVGLPPGLTRNGLRVGLTLWAPMRPK